MRRALHRLRRSRTSCSATRRPVPTPRPLVQPVPNPTFSLLRLASTATVSSPASPDPTCVHFDNGGLQTVELEEGVRDDLEHFQRMAAKVEAVIEDPLRLRPYQIVCVRNVLDALRQGYSRVGVSAPTGSGKTACFTALIGQLPPLINPYTSRHATRVLILVSSIELARQALDTVRRWLPHLTVEIEQGQDHVATGLADVTVATYQTLARSDYRRLQKFNPNEFKAVIVDEAHHCVAKSYLEILSYFDSRIRNFQLDLAKSTAAITTSSLTSDELPVPELGEPEAPVHASVAEDGRVVVPILGFTATFGRADGLALGKVFETIAFHSNWIDLVDRGWLSQVKITTVWMEFLNLDKVEMSRSSGDLVTADLSRAMNTKLNNEMVVASWSTKAADRKSTLVFCVNVEHIITLANEFRAAGVDARVVHEGTPTAERRATLAAFKAGECPVLVNHGILTEGADFPNIDCVLLARPTASKNLYLQMIGRGLRLSSETGKEDCLILDCVGVSTSGKIVTAPTLFGLDPTTVVQEQTTSQLRQRATVEEEEAKLALADKERLVHAPYSIRYAEYSKVLELLKQTRTDPISTLSSLGWVACANGVFILELLGKGRIRVFETPPGSGPERFTATVSWRLTKSPMTFGRALLLARHDDFGTLISSVDLFVKSDVRTKDLDLDRHARWRSNPASDSQLARITSLLSNDDSPADETIDGVWVDREGCVRLKDLDRGEAANAITRLVHGGRRALRHLREAELGQTQKRRTVQKLLQ